MNMRIYEVTVGTRDGGSRLVKVPSRTDVQAGDAAVTRMAEGETILSIRETEDPYQELDAAPAGAQTHPDEIV